MLADTVSNTTVDFFFPAGIVFEKCAREHSDLNTGNVLLKVVVKKKENQHTSANCSLQKLSESDSREHLGCEGRVDCNAREIGRESWLLHYGHLQPSAH